jgi:hypothetical protein
LEKETLGGSVTFRTGQKPLPLPRGLPPDSPDKDPSYRAAESRSLGSVSEPALPPLVL